MVGGKRGQVNERVGRGVANVGVPTSRKIGETWGTLWCASLQRTFVALGKQKTAPFCRRCVESFQTFEAPIDLMITLRKTRCARQIAVLTAPDWPPHPSGILGCPIIVLRALDGGSSNMAIEFDEFDPRGGLPAKQFRSVRRPGIELVRKV